MLPGHLDPAAQRRLADSQVMRDALIGVSWLLIELDGLLLELGAANLAVCHGAPLSVVWTLLSISTH